jgi:hypothetical protein
MRSLLVVLSLAAGLAHGASYYVEDTTGTGISAEDGIAVLQFVRSAVSDNGHTVASEKERSDFQLRPKLMRLGKSYVFTLEKRTPSALVHSGKMKTPEIEELDDVVSRVTRAVLKGVPVTGDERVSDVTQDEETRGMRRKPAKSGKFLAFGPTLVSNVNSTGVGFYLGFAYSWDVNQMMVRLRGDLSIRGAGMLTDFGLGASYFLGEGSVAPFVGLDVGFGVARVDRGGFLLNDTVTGFTVGPLVGVHLLRTNTINIEVALRAIYMLKAGVYGNPSAYVLRVGLYF